jgi:acyl dehydratase
MLTMALSLRPLHAAPGTWLGSITSRFRAQVWPGDSLFARVDRDDEGQLRVLTINQRGAVVLETSATIGGGSHGAQL